MVWTTLPGWIYRNEEFFALEREAIFMRSWQLAGHESEIPAPGDYLRFDLLGESAILLRDREGGIRAFYNVCRHRAFRLLDGHAGHCGRAIRCRYHGFLYDLSGSLVAVPAEEAFDGLDKTLHGLRPIETEVFMGLVFIRFGGEGPSVAEHFAPYRDTLARYRIAEMKPLGDIVTAPIQADWKVAVENNIEAYHVAPAHPGLQRLYGTTYRLETQPLGVSHGGGTLREEPSPNWSERHYLKILPPTPHLENWQSRGWYYYAIFPNLAFDIYPDQIDYFQILPVAPGIARSRSRAFALPDERREMRLARYLNQRINRIVGREDVHLVEGVQAGLGSRGYGSGILSGKEARVRQMQQLVLEAIPVAGDAAPPPPGQMAARNRALLEAKATGALSRQAAR
jgi:phenylpropionate dioxygenase-like ring-hydroxylating dioxygenase large terminal subunit